MPKKRKETTVETRTKDGRRRRRCHLAQRWVHVEEEGPVDVVAGEFAKVRLVPTAKITIYYFLKNRFEKLVEKQSPFLLHRP